MLATFHYSFPEPVAPRHAGLSAVSPHQSRFIEVKMRVNRTTPAHSATDQRRAVFAAIARREWLLQMLALGTTNLPADLPFSDGVLTRRQWLRRELPEPLPYDPARAQALLDAAGWRDHNGVREREGRSFRFNATAYEESGLPRLAVLVQAHLCRVGVQMDIELARYKGRA